jgi:ATP-dependent Zn protease
MKPETKAESTAPEHKSELASASVPKTDGNNSVPSSKAPLMIFFYFFPFFFFLFFFFFFFLKKI